MIFRNGEMVRRVAEAEIVDALMEELASWEAENQHRLPKTTDAEGLGRRKLPVVTA
jgi:(E)-4-hydroxy-3-methylbut-2-enyl-diphosphate synthase